MDKANLKTVLQVVRNMIDRSRVVYKDYLGEETVTETKVLVEGTLFEGGDLTLKDPSFTGFVIGESYDVTIDGVTQALVAVKDLSGDIVVTNVTDFTNLPENCFVIYAFSGEVGCEPTGTYVGKGISISQSKTTTRKKYAVKKLPQELLPDSVGRKIKTVEHKANAAAESAEAAIGYIQTVEATARQAKTTAVNAYNLLFQRYYDTPFYTWDGVVSEDMVTSFSVKDGSFIEVYYKVAEFSEELFDEFSDIGHSIVSYGKESTVIQIHAIYDGSYVKIAHYVVCAKEPGTYTWRYGGSSLSATIPSAGLYIGNRTVGKNYFYLASIYAPKYGQLLASTTPNSTKKFKITVDDTGTISATEVTT